MGSSPLASIMNLILNINLNQTLLESLPKFTLIIQLFIFLFLFFIILSSNIVYVVFYLILIYFFCHLMLLSLNVEFLAVFLFIIYMGALSIFFLFVLMLLNIIYLEDFNASNRASGAKILDVFIFTLFYFYISYNIIFNWFYLFKVPKYSLGIGYQVKSLFLNDIFIFTKLYTDFFFFFLLITLFLLSGMFICIFIIYTQIKKSI
jgi:NADH:ubiquinone oxidoreductase subunit 6 (subunit J)